ncbi:inner membrane-spanning protein YciB [Qingshengfaniella alkalisoli]|uniref:Inner membrane-spanning protein YciB n=1 Tax=Qingshengfaniella alkalisoli TaxID=2599296 RepID=A0A5B8J4D5_9RHOB|nr:inner membrane-spanning protein YciB [Qingshengfaniella alkalisoli]QDY69130.1 septation protein IspZ [Qingshengfaniella alkalisoli]
MAERKVNPIMKLGLELGPIIAFFLAYGRLKDQVFTIGGTEYSGFIVVTAAFIPLLLVCTGILWVLSGKLSRMQIVTAVLVVVFGGMSIAFNDERFFKMKPSIIYAMFAGILGFGLLQGKSYLSYVMSEVVPLQDEGWMVLTKRVALFFAGLMVANEVIWRTMSTDAWVNFKTFGLPIATVAFFMLQGRLFSAYALPEEKKAGE